MFFKPDLGKPLFNLDISSYVDPIVHSRVNMTTERLLVYGEAAKAAERFHGINHVTEKGYIVPGFVEGLDRHKGHIDIEQNLSELYNMNRVLDGKMENGYRRSVNLQDEYKLSLPIIIEGIYGPIHGVGLDIEPHGFQRIIVDEKYNIPMVEDVNENYLFGHDREEYNRIFSLKTMPRYIRKPI